MTGAGRASVAASPWRSPTEGARVAVLGRTLSKCESGRRTRSPRAAAQAIAIACDVEHRDQIEASVARVIDEWGRLDLLVNNAQTRSYQSIRKLTDDDMETMWQSGPLASFRFMQACFPHLRESKGCVINMGSGSGILPARRMSGYAMTKEAVRTLSRVGAVEWGRFGIRVNSICPLAESPGARRVRRLHAARRRGR